MRKILILYGLLLTSSTVLAEQIAQYSELIVLSDSSQRTVYFEKSTQQPLQGEYRLIKGLDEEQVKLSAGMMVGEYRRYRDGILREFGHYANGKRDGVFTQYYQDGITRSKVTPMKDGKINGVVRTYFRNAKLASEKDYAESVENGRERRFDFKTGELIFESHYVAGKKEGEEWEIEEGGHAIQGKTTRYYKSGKLDGVYRVEMTQKGKPYIRIEGQYANGVKSGRWKQYNAIDDTTLEWGE